jgi:hypothetical protein
VGRGGDKPRMFSVSEAALLLEISESYLSTLEHEHSMYARRNQRGARVYSAADIAILRWTGVGPRPGRLRFEGVAKELGLHAPFGFDPPRGSLEALEHARVVKLLEQKELERLRTIREDTWRRRAEEWRG